MTFVETSCFVVSLFVGKVFLVVFVLVGFGDLYFRRLIIFPQQRKLKGSSAQTSSGVFRCGSQEQVPEAGSGRFRRVPVCAGGSGEFRCVLV